MVFLQSNVIMPAGRLRVTENKRTCRISGLKSGHGHIKKKFKYWSLTIEFVKTVFDWETKKLFSK